MSKMEAIQAVIRVKPLPWQQSTGNWWTAHAFGQPMAYQIARRPGHYQVTQGIYGMPVFDTLEEAKAACQAHAHDVVTEMLAVDA